MGLIRPSARTVAALAVSCGVLVGAGVLAQSTKPSSLQVQVQDTLKGCFQCHGENGVSVIPSRPSIAGQKVDYVRRQLLAFKRAAAEGSFDGDVASTENAAALGIAKRSDPVMEHMVAGLPDHLVSPVASAISQLACDGGVAKAKRATPLSMPLAAQKCVVCHGEDGIGRQASVPNLAGQQRSYLRRQLLLIRETAWGAKSREGEAWRSHPIMETQAARLKITEIDAIGKYYAGLNCRGAKASLPVTTLPK